MPTTARSTSTLEFLTQLPVPHSTLTRNGNSVVSWFHTWTSPMLEPTVKHSGLVTTWQ